MSAQNVLDLDNKLSAEQKKKKMEFIKKREERRRKRREERDKMKGISNKEFVLKIKKVVLSLKEVFFKRATVFGSLNNLYANYLMTSFSQFDFIQRKKVVNKMLNSSIAGIMSLRSKVFEKKKSKKNTQSVRFNNSVYSSILNMDVSVWA